SFAGAFVHHDLLWTFTQIPYASAHSPYGSGSAFHFVEQLLYVLGVPIYILFWIGVLYVGYGLATKRLAWQPWFLPIAALVAFIGGHTAFWTFGLFNSMGLNRVLVSVVPLAAVVALAGLNTLAAFAAKRWPKAGPVVLVLLAALVVVFPFTANPAAIDRQHDLMLDPGQRLARTLAADLRPQLAEGARIVSAHPDVCLVFDRDRFDTTQWLDLSTAVLATLRPNDLVVWEDWFAVVEAQVPEEQLARMPSLTCILRSSVAEHGRTSHYAVYRRTNTAAR
ncbi:MAG TPA: hypothetical protein VHL57_00065, partial [Flavobacteriales bacterium]|nr:hypothetical protein [Flavobacteriales bacterium]